MLDSSLFHEKIPTTYSAAARKTTNVLNELDFAAAVQEKRHQLWNQRHAIESVVRHHLRLTSDDVCTVLDPSTWIQGAFNICVLVEVVSQGSTTKYVFRCPKPFRREEQVDEKMRSEIGAYVWVQENCQDIRVPHLLGFGLPNGDRFTHITHQSFHLQILNTLQRVIRSICGKTILSQYMNDPIASELQTSYMLLEFIEPDTGQMLSNTYERYKDNPKRRQNLFRGLARIMLSLARISHRSIGSLQFNGDGTVTLTNRYLSCSLAIMENDGAPQTIQRDDQHTCTESFVSDLLDFYDTKFRTAQNAAFDEHDCRGQMAVMSLVRAIAHRFIKREHRQGPFFLQLTDVNPSNIFVDDEWNVTCLIDLEWVCSLPAEMLSAPYWFTGCGIDEIRDDMYDEYNRIRREFMDVLEQEEQMATMQHEISIANTMNEMWDSKGVWFWYCLASIDAMTPLLEDHLSPSMLTLRDERTISGFWCDRAEDVVKEKVADKAEYDRLLQSRYGEKRAEEVIELDT